MQYKPLDKTKNEIRVLKFMNSSSPVSSEDTIRCSIGNVSLGISRHFQSHQDSSQGQKSPIAWDRFTKSVDLRDSTLEQTTLDKATHTGLRRSLDQHSNSRYTWGDFEALSYTWGDADDKKGIIVNGIPKDVPRNLEEALRALRGLQETRSSMCYWVDSLCIDQGNIEERNEQVKRMKDIYGRARAVVVWLGQEEEMDRIAVQTMHHLCRNPCVKNTLQLPAVLLDGWSALFAFTQKPYWNRCWIIQELAMNHNSTLFMCGKYKLTRRMLRLGALYCQEFLQVSEDRNYQSKHDLELAAWAMAGRMYRLASLVFDADVGLGLDPLLNLVRRADATDKKDKVYSILGLLDPSISSRITPNYSLPVQQVYTDFMKSVIDASERLDQIVFRGIPAEDGWSSWVPDWRELFQRHHIRYLRSRQASGNPAAQFRFIKKGKGLTSLACNGFWVDTVDGIAAEPSLDCHATKSTTTSDRYGGRTSEALHQSFRMGHPAMQTELLFKVPWNIIRDTDDSHANFTSNPDWLELSQSSYFERFNNFREHNKDFRIGGQKFQTFFPQSDDHSVDIAFTLRCMRLALLSLDHRALITTTSGYFGMAPVATRSGDVIAILLGCNCPVVLRPCDDGLYRIIGECYIQGLMNGEILNQEQEGLVTKHEFVLC
ncbi:heterokaryon incompatibility protein-domain-containing protein [Alternaria rosae]|uniref:heterokaryon incompatibility protein-domain-containing protein n=1 Tax=Alternaria rosae TaxID=1187941 RepID=UPI001E8CC58B|nr:heterokaryon incompatibility protein-domain-containing protein [Alternaria rosae]KAH6879268.1 heterokaryon incompatibility protein-domain-containing protein [Alternaria rosae]